MYGYVVPQKSTLTSSDFVLYRSFYCGMCCQTGKLYGQIPRFTTNYDFAFLAALLHDYSAQDIVIEEHTCILNTIKKKAVVQPNPLLERLAAANIMLSYQKAQDGVEDGDGIKYRAVRSMLKKPFKKASAAYPTMWNCVSNAYKKQRETENAKVKSIDRAAEPFAALMSELPEYILCRKTDDNMRLLCYNIGKFVYLTDALDDITDDFKAKRYNPFLSAYGDFKDRKSFIAAHADDLRFCFMSLCARAGEIVSDMNFTQSARLIRNIVCDGMRSKAEQLLSSDRKLPPPRI